MQYLLGADIGTSSAKIIIVDRQRKWHSIRLKINGHMTNLDKSSSRR